jgi:hypothetical protein
MSGYASRVSDHRRRKRTTTDQQYTQMLRRMVRAWGRRASEDLEANLANLRDLEAELDTAANLAIYRANRIGGLSINRIAATLRVSKQAAHKRVLAGELLARQQPQQWDARLTAARPRELPSPPTS